MSWFGAKTGGGSSGPSTSSGWGGTGFGGGTGGGGGSKWINMETGGIRTIATGELTGEKSEFANWGFDLTRKQRIMGFVGCLIAGFALSILGSILFFLSTALFAILFSLGFIVSLMGTGFLIGFKSQLKQMFKPIRVVATIVMFACFAMVWVSVFAIKEEVLAIVFCVLLYLAYIWYCLSYIPYARTFVKNIFSKLF